MRTEPVLSPFTTPVLETVATFLSELFQVMGPLPPTKLTVLVRPT